MKVYKDASKPLIVQDESGLKTIEQISNEFKGSFIEITEEFNKEVLESSKPSKEQLELKELDDLINAKIRELAIDALKKEGKLDQDGKIKK